MKPLILSFFAVILCYSLFTNDEKQEAISEPVLPSMNENSVYFEVQPSLQPVDSIVLFKENIAAIR